MWTASAAGARGTRHRDDIWPEDKIVPYSIQLDEGPRIFAPSDDDSVIMKLEPSCVPSQCMTMYYF